MRTPKYADNVLSNTIAEHITEQIVSGELEPGEKLVEDNYAKEYGTSRAPVREAIYILAIEGLVERIPHKGAIVKRYLKTEIYDLLEIRNMLEKMAVDRIKEHGIDQKLLEEMKEILNRMKAVVHDVRSYTQLNHSFHKCLIKMSKSSTIMEMYLRLGWPLLRVQNLSFAKTGNIEKSIAEHEKIIELLSKQYMAELSDVLIKHNEDVISSITAIIDLQNLSNGN
ncbi:GntR family transcriptional regulator [Bacillus norwichensis]|uniref:GntR family transcriptional regulator n=1 Tax=Bacillus norwichensis TaxID=2762217 RepID=A0ABR8VK53_9BACI|nr:GntR family transcriptional regulator [Bacillus norwichensis]MBD8005157.1 GntR family transcriptional regulator [Bacillus norwichensis]